MKIYVLMIDTFNDGTEFIAASEDKSVLETYVQEVVEPEKGQECIREYDDFYIVDSVFRHENGEYVMHFWIEETTLVTS